MSALTEIPITSGAPSPDRERWANLMGQVAANQDRAAFAELFQYFAPRVKAYLLRLGSGTALAEELAQEVMVTVWRKAHLFDRTQASVSTWIFRVARNRRIDAARRTNHPALDPEEPALKPADTPAPDEALGAQQDQARMRTALTHLPESQLDLLRLAFYEGLSHREIAERRDLPLGTVKSRIRLAFAKLRAVLADGADTD